MDADRFDSLIRNIGAGASRRLLLGGLLGAAVLGLLRGPETEAKRKPKRRKAAHKDKAKNNKHKHQQQRRRKNAKRTPDGAQTEAVTDACKRLCELVFPPGQKRERCLQRAAEHQVLCECVSFCRRVYPRDLSRQLACLKAAAEGDTDGLCLQCGADPERHCAGICCAAPGQCVNGACDDEQDLCVGRSCDDGNACTVDSCDPATGLCIFTPIDCDDDNACTTDRCDPATGRCVNTPINCDDDDPCTEDRCDEATGACVHERVTCPDGQVCIDGDCACPGECCADADCDDDNACTIDSCDLATHTCVHATVVCDDGVDCTEDTCDPQRGCVHTPNHDLCTAPNACFTATCDPNSGCVETELDCDDGNPCTIDSCSGGVCRHTQNPSICDDGLQCTDDICVLDPEDPRGYHCESNFDPRNCGIHSSCQEPQCGVGNDCTLVDNDNLCPSSSFSCLVPKCNGHLGCGFEDICDASHPLCLGSNDCSCNTAVDKCVPTNPV